MGKRGPAPKGRQILALAGSNRAHDGRGDKPVCTGRPVKPSWLGPIASKRWRVLVGELERMGIIGTIDGEILAAFCVACEEMQLATETLQQEGHYLRGPKGGLSAHPAVAQQRSAMRAIAALGNVLGLNPAARQRLEVPTGGTSEPPDPLEDLLNEPTS